MEIETMKATTKNVKAVTATLAEVNIHPTPEEVTIALGQYPSIEETTLYLMDTAADTPEPHAEPVPVAGIMDLTQAVSDLDAFMNGDTTAEEIEEARALEAAAKKSRSAQPVTVSFSATVASMGIFELILFSPPIANLEKAGYTFDDWKNAVQSQLNETAEKFGLLPAGIGRTPKGATYWTKRDRQDGSERGDACGDRYTARYLVQLPILADRESIAAYWEQIIAQDKNSTSAMDTQFHANDVHRVTLDGVDADDIHARTLIPYDPRQTRNVMLDLQRASADILTQQNGKKFTHDNFKSQATPRLLGTRLLPRPVNISLDAKPDYIGLNEALKHATPVE